MPIDWVESTATEMPFVVGRLDVDWVAHSRIGCLRLLLNIDVESENVLGVK